MESKNKGENKGKNKGENRNIMPENGVINGTINNLKGEIPEALRKNENVTAPEMVEIYKKSARTTSRSIVALKSKKLIERVGSNKAGILPFIILVEVKEWN